VRSFEQIIEKFPPRYASQIVLGSEDMYFLFLLPDGMLIGGEKVLDGKGREKTVNHYEIMGVTAEETDDLTTLKSEFCSANGILRVDVAHRNFYVEIFKTLPTEAQWSAIGQLYRQAKPQMVWDVWVGAKWNHGEGRLSDFKRVVNAITRQHKLSKEDHA
jgi:hypothetical protein